MDTFTIFARIVEQQFAVMAASQTLFTVDLTGDDLWDAYLEAFPEGTNPLFRERTEHDCSCCRQFIRNIGAVVAIQDNTTATVWDVINVPPPYDTVTAALSALVKSREINGRYITNERKFGAQTTIEALPAGKTITWPHFCADVPVRHRNPNPAKKRGDYNTSAALLLRALTELTADATSQVLELIDANALYRGEEHKPIVHEFQKAQAKYATLQSDADRNRFIWANAGKMFARFRNTVIGTLITDLSDGVPLEKAVKGFESKVAPANYKRPKALITPKMIESAMATIRELDLEPALERRFARIDDVSVNNVLWVNNPTQAKMRGGMEALLMEAAVKPTQKDAAENAEPITIDEFMANIAPKARTIEALVSNSQTGNFMSLTAPVHEDVKPLFKWKNNFAWSYDGNITDSDIRQAVQARGGRVDGVLRFSHSWNHPGQRNASLMDLHVFMPGSTAGHSHDGRNDTYGNGERVGWNNRKHRKSGGVQDVDHVEAAAPDFIPVENITFPSIDHMPDGDYHCKIHNWKLRPPTTGGFRAEIEFGGQVFEYEYLKALANKEWVTVATVTKRNGEFSIRHHLKPGCSSQEKWGIETETFVPVNTVMLSPNHWDDNATGNKHWFFVLDGCKADVPARGIYNEFLAPGLEQHRKVFEVLGNKTQCQPTDDQLSGIGFSSTRKDSVVVTVQGENLRKTYQINF